MVAGWQCWVRLFVRGRDYTASCRRAARIHGPDPPRSLRKTDRTATPRASRGARGAAQAQSSRVCVPHSLNPPTPSVHWRYECACPENPNLPARPGYAWRVRPIAVRIDGLDCAPEAAAIPVTDDGLLRGDGVFEVMRVYGGAVFALRAHLDRLARSAHGLHLQVDISAMADDSRALASRATDTDAVIRLIATRGGRRIAMLESLPRFPTTVSLATVEHEPDPLVVGLKTLSYAANTLATRIAQERAADQALLVTPAGRVLEGANFAIFVAFDRAGPLVTPPLTEGILSSITRLRLIDLVNVDQRPLLKPQLAYVREAFAASTLREVLPVRAIDDVELPDVPGVRTVAAARALQDHILRSVSSG